MINENQEFQKVNQEIEHAKTEILEVPASKNTIIDKELIKNVIENLNNEINQLKIIETEQSENVKKVIVSYSKTINSISKLLEKETITSEERKYYTDVAKGLLLDVTEFVKEDSNNKKEDKKFHRQLIKMRVYTISAATLIPIVGNIAVKIIKSLDKR